MSINFHKQFQAIAFGAILVALYHIVGPTAALMCVGYLLVVSTWDVF